jgi:ribosomal protein L11 methyltransferase
LVDTGNDAAAATSAMFRPMTAVGLPWRGAVCEEGQVTKSWLEVTVEVPREWSDAVANFLLERGSPGLQSLEHDGTTSLIAYFSETPPLDALHRFCADIGWQPEDAAIRTRALADEDWAENWKLHFQPQTIGTRWYVCPSWQSEIPAGRIGIVIDPGMAFGTGHHASTRGCLVLLEAALERRKISTAIDLGSGSGILAIALAKLGVPDVWAIDTDPAAHGIAAANAELNGVAQQVRIMGSLPPGPTRTDLVVANLFANALIDLAPRLRDILRPAGTLICAGFLTADEAQLCATYQALGFKVEGRWQEHPWVALAFQRRDVP